YKPGQCWCSLRSTLRRFPVTPGATTTSAGHTKPANSTSTGHAIQDRGRAGRRRRRGRGCVRGGGVQR
ncbi:unnamed protein product, partial [Didymodactylos carnosus]